MKMKSMLKYIALMNEDQFGNLVEQATSSNSSTKFIFESTEYATGITYPKFVIKCTEESIKEGYPGVPKLTVSLKGNETESESMYVSSKFRDMFDMHMGGPVCAYNVPGLSNKKIKKFDDGMSDILHHSFSLMDRRAAEAENDRRNIEADSDYEDIEQGNEQPDNNFIIDDLSDAVGPFDGMENPNARPLNEYKNEDLDEDLDEEPEFEKF